MGAGTFGLGRLLDVKYLEKEKEAKEKELKEVNQTIKRFIASLKDGTETLELIEDELEKLERKKDELEKEINLLRIQIEERKRYALNGRILKNYLDEFDFLFDRLKPIDQQRVLQVLLREIVFYGDKIKISLWIYPKLVCPFKKFSILIGSPILKYGPDHPRRTHFDFYIVLEASLNLTQLLSFSSLKKFCKIQP